MKYWDKVKVVWWFYDWLEWIVKRYDDNQLFYTVQLKSYLEEDFVYFFKEEDLEQYLIEGNNFSETLKDKLWK